MLLVRVFYLFLFFRYLMHSYKLFAWRTDICVGRHWVYKTWQNQICLRLRNSWKICRELMRPPWILFRCLDFHYSNMKNYLLSWKNLSKIIQCILFVTCIVINIITINAFKPYFFSRPLPPPPPPPTTTKCTLVKNNPLRIMIYKNLNCWYNPAFDFCTCNNYSALSLNM